jgi:hypothetical protein
VSVDWMHRDSARANIRRHVKRLLRKYGYPPDLQDAGIAGARDGGAAGTAAVHIGIGYALSGPETPRRHVRDVFS